jgi:hypothetical protein
MYKYNKYKPRVAPQKEARKINKNAPPQPSIVTATAAQHSRDAHSAHMRSIISPQTYIIHNLWAHLLLSRAEAMEMEMGESKGAWLGAITGLLDLVSGDDDMAW